MTRFGLLSVSLAGLALITSSCRTIHPGNNAPDPTADTNVPLQKAPDKDFVVLNLSDPQLSANEWQAGTAHRAVLLKTIETLVARVKPDLITVSGDLAYGDQHKSYECLASYLDTFAIPWTLVWGNHDNQAGAENMKVVAAKMRSHPYCIFRDGPADLGNGNYVIEIRENGAPVTALFMMDTHDREPWPTPDKPDNKCWSKLYPNQLVWYKNKAAALKTAGFKDSAMIMHIPIFAYRQAFAAAYHSDIPADKISYAQTLDGSCWNPEYKNSFGYNHEGICSYPAEEGAFAALKEAAFTTYLLCGHDHVNNTVITYNGITLAYSLKAGAGCYWEHQANGGTVITIGHDGIKGLRHEFVDVSEYADKFKK